MENNTDIAPPTELELVAAEINLSNRFPALAHKAAARFGLDPTDPQILAFGYSMYLDGVSVVGTISLEVQQAVKEAKANTVANFKPN